MSDGTKLPGSLTFFFPCFNDSRTISGLVEVSASVGARCASDFEILVVDDCSTDESREILKNLQAGFPFLKVIYHEKNLGYGAALRSGFKHATKDFVFYTDGDGQYDPRELEIMIPFMTEETVLVNGYKIKRSDAFYRVIGGNVYAAFVKFIFSLEIKDPDCDFRLFRRSVLPAGLKSSNGAICVELVKKIQNTGGKIEQIPVTHYPRKFGGSQFFNFKAVIRTFNELVALWFDLMRPHGIR